jgi:hypothetical protein
MLSARRANRSFEVSRAKAGRPQDRDAALASDDGPTFSTVVRLVEALKRSIPEGTQNAERRKEARDVARELLRLWRG